MAGMIRKLRHANWWTVHFCDNICTTRSQFRRHCNERKLFSWRRRGRWALTGDQIHGNIHNCTLHHFLANMVTQSQRDLSNTMPINHVTTPGVSITAACFSQLHYENDDAALCISNLLAVGFRRFEVDLYWDCSREAWQFCPVSIPESVGGNMTFASSSSTSGSPNVNTSISTTTQATKVARQASSSTADTRTTSFSSATSSNILTTIHSSLGQTAPTYPSLSDSSDNTQLSLGP